jgi:hypothetical protein
MREYAIAYRPTTAREDAPWAIQLVLPDGNLLVARAETRDEAQAIAASLSAEDDA